MELRIQRLEIERGKRVLAVSDIHGRPEWLARVLREAGFGQEDELFILGDLIEKGPENLASLRYCRELSRQENVHILMGNCDTAWEDVLTDEDCNSLSYMLWRKDSILNEMCRLLGLSITPRSDYPTLRQKMREAFFDELSWLSSLPHVITTDAYTFVHAGLAEGECIAWNVMKSDYFYDRCVQEDKHFTKWMVLGHMPVSNYCHKIGSNAPLIDWERRIANIDGGTIQPGGQLNLIDLTALEEGDVRFYCADDLPEAEVLAPQAATEDPVYLGWGDSFAMLSQPPGEYVLCRAGDRELRIPKKRIFSYPDGALHCTQGTDYCLPLSPGERVKVVDRYGDRSYCKTRDGVMGWAANDKLRLQ